LRQTHSNVTNDVQGVKMLGDGQRNGACADAEEHEKEREIILLMGEPSRRIRHDHQKNHTRQPPIGLKSKGLQADISVVCGEESICGC